MVLEQKHNNKWVGINDFSHVPAAAVNSYGENGEERPYGYFWKVEGRNYRLFAALASVRGEGHPAKGIPDDVSDLTQLRLDDWGSDGHSHSWDYLEDVLGIFAAHLLPENILDANRVDKTLELFGNPDRVDLEDLRIVYWFDN